MLIHNSVCVFNLSLCMLSSLFDGLFFQVFSVFTTRTQAFDLMILFFLTSFCLSSTWFCNAKLISSRKKKFAKLKTRSKQWRKSWKSSSPIKLKLWDFSESPKFSWIYWRRAWGRHIVYCVTFERFATQFSWTFFCSWCKWNLDYKSIFHLICMN